MATAPRLLQRATWGTPRATPAPRARRQDTEPNLFDTPVPTTAPVRTSETTRTTSAPNLFDSPGAAAEPAPAGAKRTEAAPPKRRDDPIRRVQVNVAKMLAVQPRLPKPQQIKLDRLLKDVGQGVPQVEARNASQRQNRALGYVPQAQREQAAQVMEGLKEIPGWSGRVLMSTRRNRAREALTAAGISPGTADYLSGQWFPDAHQGDFVSGALGAAVRQVQKPQQAIASAVGEASRQWEDNDRPFSLGGILTAGREGFNLQRHDTFSSIMQEAERLREAQGESTGPILGATNAGIRTVPGVGLVGDIAFGAATDPLTYLTFGTSSLAKGSLRVVEKVTDAATAQRVAREGISALTDAQRATVQARLGEKGWQALERGARGGLGVRPFMGPQTGRTIVPGFIPKAGARAVGQAVEQIPKVGPALKRSGEFLQDVFKPRARLARGLGQSVADQVYELEARARGYQHAGVDRAVTRLTNAMAKVNVTPEEMERFVGPQLDIGAAGRVVTGDAVKDARLQSVVDRFSEVRRELTQMQIDRGKLLADVDLPAAQARDLAVRQGQRADYMEQQLARITDPEGATRLREWDVANPVTERRFIPEAEYLPHVRTPEGGKLWDEGKVPTTSFAKKLYEDPYLQSRQLRDMSAREINERLSAEIGRPIKYFHEDPLVAFSARSRAAYGSVAGEELANGLRGLRADDGTRLVDNWDDLDDVVPPHVGPVTDVLGPTHKLQRPGYAELKLVDPSTGGVHHLSVPSEVAEVVNRTWKVIHDPTELGNAWNHMLNWWKTMATVPLPFGVGFHLRNFESNIALNWMSGIGVGMQDYRKARQLQKSMHEGIKEFGDWRHFLDEADADLVQQALEREVLSTGVLGALDELPEDPNLARGYSFGSKTAKQKAGHVLRRASPFTTKGIWATGGRRVAQNVEENARLAHFLAANRNFGDVDAAAMSVRRWLFDYHDITRNEQQIKQLIPFYTWSRKASSAVIETALRDPRKLAQFERLREYLITAGGADLSGTMVPKYMRESPTGIPFRAPMIGPFRAMAERGEPIYATPDLPLNTPIEIGNAIYGLAQNAPVLNRILPEYGHESTAESLRPFFSMLGGPAGIGKAGYEALMGQKTFSGAPIRDEWGAVPTPLNLPGFKQLFAPSGEMTPAGRNLAESIWPVIPKIEGLFPNDPRDEDKRVRRIISTFTGLQFAPVGQTTQEAEGYRRLEPISRFIRDLQARGLIG